MAPGLGPFDPDDLQRDLAENSDAEREYSTWLDTSYGDRVGRPGFFSRYAAGMGGDWQMYFASDAAVLPRLSLSEAVSRFDRVWFDAPPADLPPDICLITRDVDHAYLDLFFRDASVFEAVWDFLDSQGMEPSPYRPYDPEAPTDKRKGKRKSR